MVAISRFGVLVLVEVSGDLLISGELSDFRAGNRREGRDIVYPDTFQTFPVIFETVFSNDGNTHLTPRGNIELIDESGERLENIGKEIITSPAGAFIGERMVDYIPVNDTNGDVLPGTDRRFLSEWRGFGYNVRNEDGTTEVLFRSPEEHFAEQARENQQFLQFWETAKTRTVERPITANLYLSYVGKDAQVKEFLDSREFTIVYDERYLDYNYPVIAGIIILLIGIAGYIFIYVPRSRERLRRELMESLQQENRKS